MNDNKNGKNIPPVSDDGYNGSKTPKRAPKIYEKINWGSELANVGRVTAKVSMRVLGYLFNVLITLLLVGAITGMIVGTAFLIYVNNYVNPEIDMALFEINQNQTTTIYYTEYTDRENRIGEVVELEDQRLYGAENSLFVSYSQMTKNHKHLVNAFVAAEDRRFWDHDGVDWIRTLSAVKNFVLPSSGRLYGASTITQQLIKNITGDNDATIERKIQEIVRALNLEKHKSKKEIIEMYLNIVNLAHNCYGVQAAANTYFSKDVSELSLVECASIAAIVQSPTKMNPYSRPERNKERRDAILENMLKYGFINEEEYNEAVNTELVVKLNKDVNTGNISTNSWFTDALIEDVINDLVAEKGYTRTVASNLIYSGGLKIYATVDPKVQAILEEEYAKESNFPETTGIQPESAMVVIDPGTGDVLGLVGGRTKEGNRIQNHATMSTRPPGSSIKPISVYGPGLEYGILTYSSIYDDVPVNFGDYTVDPDPEMDPEEIVEPTPWPHNYPDRYGGLTTVSDALRRSVNTVAVRILQDLTIDRSFDFVYNKLGCHSLIAGRTLENGRYVTDKGVAALALGQLEYGITVREITSAYTMIANGGIYSESRTYTKVEDAKGNVLLSNDELGKTVMSEQNAYILTKMLQNVVTSGTATAITLDETINVAGKTGTTNSDYDRWFVGFTPYYVGGIWLGYEYPKSLTNISTSAHVRLWDAVMIRLHEDIIEESKNSGEKLKSFEEPSGIVKIEYCAASGKLVSEACKLDPRGKEMIKTGYFTVSTMPTDPCDCHVKVALCKGSGHILGPDCDQSEWNVEYVGLITEELRSFPIEVVVTDAQYVYRELPKDVLPGGLGQAFFANILGEDEFVGVSEVDSPVNQYCTLHFDLQAFLDRVNGKDSPDTDPWDDPYFPDDTDDPYYPYDPDDTEDPDDDEPYYPYEPDDTEDPDDDEPYYPYEPDDTEDPDDDDEPYYPYEPDDTDDTYIPYEPDDTEDDDDTDGPVFFGDYGGYEDMDNIDE